MADSTLSGMQQLLDGQYQLERELGRGGMGVVYLARELRLDRQVAIKVLPRELGANPELRERFLREARTAAQLSHPNIVPIFRADELDGIAFFTMGFIEGESLAGRLHDRGPCAPAEAVRILREAAWALAYAHARGVVHRDVKPENIMLERESGRVIVTDFGIARDQRATSLTDGGMVLGSVHYMSPEQAAGDALDGRSDLYALGVVGFQILSGRLPFDAEQAAAVMAQQVTRPAPPLASVAPAVPGSLAKVIDRCLSKAPDERYPSGEALASALMAALEATPAPEAVVRSMELISTTAAQAIWLRAAQLQGEATSRLQHRYQAPAGSEAAAPGDSSGYRIRDVEAAAVEAGIAAQYVAMALAERPVDGATEVGAWAPREERLITSMLGTSARSVSVSRSIQAPPARVLEAMGRVVTSAPFRLTLRDTVGGHPLDGGILLFDVPMLRSGQIMESMQTGVSMFSYRMTQIELDQLNVVLKPLGSPAAGCEVTVYGDLRPGLRKNLKIDRWVAATTAAGGATSAGAVGFAMLSLGALSLLTALGGAALLGGLSLAGYRWLYRRALRQSTEELNRLLGAVESELRAATVFGTQTRESLPRSSGPS